MFNYIDSVILIDFLIIMFTKPEKQAVPILENYLNDVENVTEEMYNEIDKNMKMNSKKNYILIYI